MTALAILIGAAIALAAAVECVIQYRAAWARIEDGMNHALDDESPDCLVLDLPDPFAHTRREIAALETTEERR